MENSNYPQTDPAFQYFPPPSAWIDLNSVSSDPNSVSSDDDKTPTWVIVGIVIVVVILGGFFFYCIGKREMKLPIPAAVKPAPAPAPKAAPAPAPKEAPAPAPAPKQAPAPKKDEKKPLPEHPPIFIPMGLPAHCPRCHYKGGLYSSSYTCPQCAWHSNRCEG